MHSNRGFTLIELITAMALGSIIMVGLLGAFISFLQHQVLGQDERNALETISFSIDSISRELYFGYDYTCAKKDTSSNNNISGIDVCTCIAFTDQLGRRIKIRANNGIIERISQRSSANPNTCNDLDSGWVPLSGRSALISYLGFTLRTDLDTQPQVGIEVFAKYDVGSEEKEFKTQTQVTRRILETTQNIASTFRVSDISNLLASNYYVQYENGICVDETGNVYDNEDFSPCEIDLQPITSEFTNRGLFVLLDNGLLAFISQVEIDRIFNSNNIGSIRSSSFSNNIKIVKADSQNSDGIFDDDTPKNILEIYSAGNDLIAKSRSGALYKISVKDDGTPSPKRLFSGDTFTRNNVRLATSYNDSLLVLYRDNQGQNKFRYYNGLPNIISSSCVVLNDYSSVNNGCNELQTLLSNVSLSLIKGIQITPNSLFHIWYTDNSSEKYLAVFSDGETFSEIEGDPLPFGYEFTYDTNASSSAHYAVCKNGEKICKYNFIPNESVVESKTLKSASDGNVIVDTVYLQDKIFSILNDGSLVSLPSSISGQRFNEINQLRTIIDVDGGLPYNSIFCGVQPRGANPFGNVLFQHLSQKHPSRNYFSSVVSILEDINDDSLSNELFLMSTPSNVDPQNPTKNKNECINEEFLERYTARSDSKDKVEIIRLYGVKFRIKE